MLMEAKGLLKLGVSYGQLDRWTRRGWLHADVLHPGYGGRRVWSEQEREVARRMAVLVAAGVTAEAAHFAVRNSGLLPGAEVRVEFAEDAAQGQG